MRKGVILQMPSTLPQVSTYVEHAVKDELADLAAHNRRLSVSALVGEALEIAMPELRARYGYKSLGQSRPAYEKPRRKKHAA